MLGIHFSCEHEQIIRHNFHERLSEIQKTIHLWGLRGLSLTIIKTFRKPKLVYVSTILETPEEIIKQMERMIDKFLCKDQIKWQDSPLLTRFKTVA